jgi:hypothetical protein
LSFKVDRFGKQLSAMASRTDAKAGLVRRGTRMAIATANAAEARGGNMDKNLLKGLTIFTLMVALAIVTSVVSANAQSRMTVSTNIPFEFVVGDHTLPAGEYVIEAVISGGAALAIRGSDNGESVVRLAEPIGAMSKRKSARLVFHRYGQNYFLTQIWSGDSLGRQLVKSKQERATERELASIPSKSELAESTYETIEVVAVLR